MLSWVGNVGAQIVLYIFSFFGVELKLKKKETKRYIAVKNGTLKLNDFNRRWGLFLH